MTADEFVRQTAGYAFLAFTRRAVHDLDRNIIGRLPHLQGVSVYATGYEWIDVAALNSRDIAFWRIEDYCTEAVAEHALGMLLTMIRRIHLSHDRSRKLIDASVSLRGTQLSGKTIAILGYGRIGRRFERILTGFDTRVLKYDPAVPDADAPDRDTLLRIADAVVLCANHIRGAPPIIGAPQLQLMKHGALLINPSRANLVDHFAVIAAIGARTLAGYAIDDTLPILQEHLHQLEPGRILQTAHTAWYSEEALEKGTATWVDNICRMVTSH